MAKQDTIDERALPSLALALGYLAVKDLEKSGDQVDVLSRLGYGTLEIARICDITPGNVRTILSRKRSAGRKR